MTNENFTLSLLKFDQDALLIDPEFETERIVDLLCDSVYHRFHKQGGVVGIRGDIQSSVVLALAVRSFGSQKVLGVFLPEQKPSPASACIAKNLAVQFGVELEVENLAPMFDGFGCSDRQEDAVKRLFPQFGQGWKARTRSLSGYMDPNSPNLYSMIVTDPEGNEYQKRISPRDLSQIASIENFKQRIQMAALYYHAECRNFAVLGTAMKNEYDLGLFVKYGDGGVDINPIVHLFKSQVFQLASYLGIPEEIQHPNGAKDPSRNGTAQEDLFFGVSSDVLDLVWAGYEQDISPRVLADLMGLTVEQVDRVINEIIRRHRTTEFMRKPPARL